MSTASEVRSVRASADAFADHPVFLTERRGGISPAPFVSLNLGRSTPDDPKHIRENEARAISALGVPDRVARIHLEHGAKILSVSEPGVAGTADALLTETDGLTLSLSVADCYPVALLHQSTRALIHCGWRSVDGGILEAMLRPGGAFEHPGDTHAWVGPGIGACCYPVGPEVAAHFPTSIDLHGSDPHLDLGREIRTRLHALGIHTPHLEMAGLCTSCHPERFFSHRRDGFPSGRMAAFFA